MVVVSEADVNVNVNVHANVLAEALLEFQVLMVEVHDVRTS